MPQSVKFRVKEIRNNPIEIVAGDRHKKKQDGAQNQVFQRLGRRKKEAFFWFRRQLVFPPPVKEKPKHPKACRGAAKTVTSELKPSM
jgi:hypothetical protein